MAKKLVLPRFRSEEEEVAWYDTHHSEVERDFRRRIRSGDFYIANPERLTAITIRMDAADLKAIRNQAAKKGLPYQTYIRVLLRDALRRARRAS